MRLWCVLAVVAVAACGGGPTGDAGPQTLIAKLHLEPATAKVGTSITFRLTIAHNGAGSSSFAVLHEAAFRPTVTNAAGATVWTGNADYAPNGPRDQVVLTHGEFYTATVVWPLADGAGNPLPPGVYVVTSYLDAIGLSAGFTQISAYVTITP